MAYSRRQLANYAVEQLINGQRPAKLAQHLGAALIESSKQKEVDLLILDIEQLLEDHGLTAYATVTSTQELSLSLRKQLREVVKKLAGVKMVELNQKVDKSLIGGFKLETANHSLDRSIKRQLSGLEVK